MAAQTIFNIFFQFERKMLLLLLLGSGTLTQAKTNTANVMFMSGNSQALGMLCVRGGGIKLLPNPRHLGLFLLLLFDSSQADRTLGR